MEIREEEAKRPSTDHDRIFSGITPGKTSNQKAAFGKNRQTKGEEPMKMIIHNDKNWIRIYNQIPYDPNKFVRVTMEGTQKVELEFDINSIQITPKTNKEEEQ